MTEYDAAEILAGRGATLDLDDGDVVTDVVIVCRISNAAAGDAVDTASRVVLGCTGGTEWLDRFALIKAADNILSFAAWRREDGEE